MVWDYPQATTEAGFARLPGQLMSQRPGSWTRSGEASGVPAAEVTRAFAAPLPGAINDAGVRLVGRMDDLQAK